VYRNAVQPKRFVALVHFPSVLGLESPFTIWNGAADCVGLLPINTAATVSREVFINPFVQLLNLIFSQVASNTSCR
jgi:hypothetical protein